MFLGNGGQLKNRLLQCYVLLWIHNIDAIYIIFDPESAIHVTDTEMVGFVW